MNIVILVCWTIFDPLRWIREDISFDPYGRVTESIGSCQSTHTIPYLVALLTANAGLIVVASYQSYVARKISTEFSESDYIAKSVTLVLIVFFMAGPMFMVVDQSTKGHFFMAASSVFSVSLSLLLLIFVPKVWYQGEGVKTAIRRSMSMVEHDGVQATRLSMSMVEQSCKSDPDDVGTAVINHPKLDFELAERLRYAEREIRRLKACQK